MDEEEIKYWKDKYDQEEDLYDKTLEKRLRKKFQKNNFVTKADLIKVVGWKFQSPRLAGRRKRVLGYVALNKESAVRKNSKLAFKSKDDRDKLRLLSAPNVRGVGSALSSVILTFYNPKNYGILDIHAWRCLFDKEPSDLFSNPKNAIKFFSKLREISSKTNIDCRDIEKALFKKDLDKSKT